MDMPQVTHRRWTRAEYDQLIEQGFFEPGERLELVDGEIIVMTPQKGQHALAVGLVMDALQPYCGQTAHLRMQLPLALGSVSEPEPDVAVIRGQRRQFPEHPTSAILVVEVADTSLGYDRLKKAPLYAKAGIAEYWIVNLVDRVLDVHRRPEPAGEGWRYADVHQLDEAASVRPEGLPDAMVPVAALLP